MGRSVEDMKARRESANAASRRWRARNPEKVAATIKAYRKRKPEVVAAVDLRYRERNREKLADKARVRRKNDPAKTSETNRRYRQRHPDRVVAHDRAKVLRRLTDSVAAENYRVTLREWKERNPERVAAGHRKYAKAHPEQLLKHNRIYYQRHSGIIREKTAFRSRCYVSPIAIFYRALTQAIYEACPPGMEVDHIVPIKGKNVTGLHVPWNLQYLTRFDNRSKGNKLLPTWEK